MSSKEHQPLGVQIYGTYRSDEQDGSFSTHTLIYKHQHGQNQNNAPKTTCATQNLKFSTEEISKNNMKIK